MSIEPGSSAKIVIEIDPANDKVRVGSSTVYDVEGARFVLAQTEPPIARSMPLGQVVVTHLVREKGEMVRYGFPARVVEFVDYTVASRNPAKALVVERTGRDAPYSIRMFFRVNPTGKSRVRMSVHKNRVNLFDISIGGARFSYPTSLVLKPNMVVEARIELQGRFHNLEARILRAWSEDGEDEGRNLKLASAEFLNVGGSLEHALSRQIFSIEREGLAKEASQ